MALLIAGTESTHRARVIAPAYCERKIAGDRAGTSKEMPYCLDASIVRSLQSPLHVNGRLARPRRAGVSSKIK